MVNEEHPTPNWHFAQYTPLHYVDGLVSNVNLGVLVTKEMLRISPKVSFFCLPFDRIHMLTFGCIADIISTVEFDHTGDYLATGDKGGRVVLFERFEGVMTIATIVLMI